MTRLARVIAHEEGFGIPGDVPTRDNNPGDLRHSPHSEHPGDPDAIGVIDTVADGWADLERQLALYASRGLTLAEAIYDFAPPSQNNSARYLADVCAAMGCGPETPMTEALQLV